MAPPHHHEVLPQGEGREASAFPLVPMITFAPIARSGPEPHMGSHSHTMPFGHSVLQDIPPGQSSG